MITARFFYEEDDITGFEVRGHATADAGDETGMIICSAVSSAAYMTANTLTEVVGADAEVEADDGFLRLRLTSRVEASQAVLEGFWLHMQQLAEEYKGRIKLLSEV